MTTTTKSEHKIRIIPGREKVAPSRGELEASAANADDVATTCDRSNPLDAVVVVAAGGAD